MFLFPSCFPSYLLIWPVHFVYHRMEALQDVIDSRQLSALLQPNVSSSSLLMSPEVKSGRTPDPTVAAAEPSSSSASDSIDLSDSFCVAAVKQAMQVVEQVNGAQAFASLARLQEDIFRFVGAHKKQRKEEDGRALSNSLN
jgi:hypothetical protein